MRWTNVRVKNSYREVGDKKHLILRETSVGPDETLQKNEPILLIPST